MGTLYMNRNFNLSAWVPQSGRLTNNRHNYIITLISLLSKFLIVQLSIINTDPVPAYLKMGNPVGKHTDYHILHNYTTMVWYMGQILTILELFRIVRQFLVWNAAPNSRPRLWGRGSAPNPVGWASSALYPLSWIYLGSLVQNCSVTIKWEKSTL